MADAYRTSVEIAATPEKVFAYLTRADEIVRWMGNYALLDPRPDGEFTVDVNGVPVRGHFLEVEPPGRLLISWGHAGSSLLPPGSSTVEITLVASATGTLVTLEHRDLPPDEARQHAMGWPHFLTRLQAVAGGQDLGPDPWFTGSATA